MILGILLTLQIIVCVLLTIVILMQRSEGGALGMGGGPSGFMTARGAGNFLTRTTAILATAFFVLSIGLTIFGNFERSSASGVSAKDVNAVLPTQAAPAAAPVPGGAAAPAGAPTAADQAPAADQGPDLGALGGGSSAPAQKAPAETPPAKK